MDSPKLDRHEHVYMFEHADYSNVSDIYRTFQERSTDLSFVWLVKVLGQSEHMNCPVFEGT
jgi:hypothetical protein